MKKTAIFLVVIMMLSVFSITAFAKNNIPVSAELSETTDGDIRIVIYTENPEKLVSFFTVIEYDVSLYSLKDAYACTTELSDGEGVENFTGSWVFGNLADKTGCVGAFVSYSGVTKNGRVAACEFIIHPETSRKNINDLKVYVKEYITDDDDEENDIYKKTPVNFTEDDAEASDNFEYVMAETVTLTGIKATNDVVFIPESIEGRVVRSLVTETPPRNAFLVFGRNVLRADKGVFNSENTVISPVGSAPEASAKLSGSKYFSYSEKVVADLKKPVFYTYQNLVNDGKVLFESTFEYGVEPSHKFLSYWGTGTEITLTNGDNKCVFSLCVKGDINGDSVCDVLDTMLCERYVNGFENLQGVELESTELTGDDEVDVQDYAQIVNQSLEGEGLAFEGVRGDLNGDYTVDVLDAFAFNKLSRQTNLSTEEKARLDFNNDGKIDLSDGIILELLIESFI